MKTVDLVVTGDETAAVGAAVDAVRRGQRVLVVLRAAGSRIVPRVRRLCRPAKHQLTVITNAEVVCVDGVHGVEAVVLRYTRTGRLCAVNASAFVSCNPSTHPPRANRRHACGGPEDPPGAWTVWTGLDSVERKSKSVSIVTGRGLSRGCPCDQQ
jgi:hypothetical protein